MSWKRETHMRKSPSISWQKIVFILLLLVLCVK